MSKLVIKNGRVVDPSQNLDRVCDLGIEDGMIQHIGDAIPATGAEQFDASGLIVAPASSTCTSTCASLDLNTPKR